MTRPARSEQEAVDQTPWHDLNAGQWACVNFVPWKRGFMRRYLFAPGNRVRFVRDLAQLRRCWRGTGQRKIAVWGLGLPDDIRDYAAAEQIPIFQVEDGFLRSVGLGKYYITPNSLIVDGRGIYFDPSRPSDLEHILQTAEFSGQELERAGRLIETIVSGGFSKYNVGKSDYLTIDARPGQKVILAPGQVEDDASIQLGCGEVRTNHGLLQAAREANPDAYIIHKPHPDVVTGNAQQMPYDTLGLADLVVTQADIGSCIAAAHEVHTLTSLTGFEALLRGRDVVTYGQPFYAGWGLTQDSSPPSRRTRRLSLEELVAGTLIRYPRYMDFDARRFVTPEQVLARLADERQRKGEQHLSTSAPRRWLVKFVFMLRGMTMR